MQLMYFSKWSESNSTASTVPHSFVMILMSVVQFTTLIKIIKKVRNPSDKIESQCKKTFCERITLFKAGM